MRARSRRLVLAREFEERSIIVANRLVGFLAG
jgi:hypothetical protein